MSWKVKSPTDFGLLCSILTGVPCPFRERTGSAADVTDAVLYLVRAGAITGQVLPVDGGRSILT